MTNNNNKTNTNKTRGRNKRSRRRQQGPIVQTITAPMAYSGTLGTPSYSIISQDGGQVLKVKGRDLLGQLYGGNNSIIVGVFDLNPACWSNSRLSFLARTFEKYRYDSFTIHYIPSLASTATGFASLYFEPEIYDDVASVVTQSLTHFTSSAGPAWHPNSITWRRPSTDPGAYLCTEKTGIERALLSQGKVCFLNENTATIPGIAAIEYEITFMYPELELGYAGVQYEVTQLTLNAAANGLIAAPPSFTSTGVKLIEYVLNDPITNVFVNVAGNPYNFLVGAVLYGAWDGGAWRLFPDIASALAKAGALFSVPALANVQCDILGRRLVFPS